MATGKKAFEGKTNASVIGAIMHVDPPPMSSLQPMTPSALDRAVKTCLAKDPDERWQTASDLCRELKYAAETGPTTPSGLRSPGEARWKKVSFAAVAMTLAVVIVSAVLLWQKATSERPLWFSVIPPDANFSSRPTLAISPDGKHIVFGVEGASGSISLWIRSFDSGSARELPGTVGGRHPFWSPDSQSVGFFANGKLHRVNIGGGSAQALVQVLNDRGGTWSPDGTIIFASGFGIAGLFRVSASGGGTASPVKVPDPSQGETGFVFPFFLPDGDHFLYFSTASKNVQHRGIYVGSLSSTQTKRILDLPLGFTAEYANGFLLYKKDGDLFAQPFDLNRMELQGEGKRIASGLGWSTSGSRTFSVSAVGSLAFSSQFGLPTSQLTWFDRSGKRLGTASDAQEYVGFALSSDQKRIALQKADRKTGSDDLWLLDLPNGIPSMLTAGHVDTPVWAPDNERILYRRNTLELVSVNSGKSEPLSDIDTEAVPQFLEAWSPDGRFVVWRASDGTRNKLWQLPLQGDRKPVVLFKTPFNESDGRISPDGHWIAYDSDESGRSEVYVQSFPQPGLKRRISREGGEHPEWRLDGRELYYLAPASGQRWKLMAVHAQASSSGFTASEPELLFETPRFGGLIGVGSAYAPFGNGDRFLLNVVADETKPRGITLILNWPSVASKS